MKVRRFNEEGISLLGEFLDSLTTDDPKPYPKEILTDQIYTSIVKPEIEVEEKSFKNRFEVGEYLFSKLSNVETENLERDRGVWSWLALFYYGEICAVDSNGKPKPGERARWIPAIGDFRKYYRHLLAGPYRIYKAYRDNPKVTLVLLCKPPYQPGEVAEQLSARQEWVSNPAVMNASMKLYFDPEKNDHKRGAATKGPGGSRRFSDILQQFDLVWDLYSLESDEILELLPSEFDKFKQN